MYRSVVILLSSLLLLLLLLSGAALFLFSPMGNKMLKPYVKQVIEEKTGLPVTLKTYRLRSGELILDMVMDRHLRVKTTAHYNLLSRTFKGVYRIKAKDFVYKGKRVSEANMHGTYQGSIDDIALQGKGTLLHAPVTYRLHLVKSAPQQIEIDARGLAFGSLLQLASQPPLAKGKVDVKIKMPHIGEADAKGRARIMLRDAVLDRKLLKRYYGVEIPKTSKMTAGADAVLNGNHITFTSEGESKLFSFALKEGNYDLESKRVKAKYKINVKEMRLFSRNKLSGPFSITGKLEDKGGNLIVTGQSRSLDGVLRFRKAASTEIWMQGLSLGKLLRFVHQPAYASGLLDGKITLHDAQLQNGSYQIAVTKGGLNAKVITQRLGYKIPQSNHMYIQAKGRIKERKFRTKVTLKSTMADAVLEHVTYDPISKVLKTPYHITLHDIESFGTGNQPHHGKEVSIDGDLHYNNRLSVNGEVKGLGKKAAFSYSGKEVKLDAVGVHIAKVLALAGMPIYLSGRVDARMKLRDIEQMDGQFSLQGKDLFIQPETMRSITGKGAKMKLSVIAKGEMKQHKAYGDATVQTSIGSIQINKIIVNLQHNAIRANYHAKLSNLQQLARISNIRLYGTLALDGVIERSKLLTITGESTSLGGTLTYKLLGNSFAADMVSVPLVNILKLTGYPQHFLGLVSGKLNYDLKQREGTANMKIASFQIEPSELTRMLTPILGKDPSRIIFKTTTFQATINKDIVTYRLIANGTHSMIEITNGRIDQKSRQQRAKLKVVYEKYTVFGEIQGTIEKPRIMLDTRKMIKEKLQQQLEKKLEKKWGEKAGAILKGLGL